MPIRHHLSEKNCVVTSIVRPVSLGDALHEIEKLATCAKSEKTWCQVVMLGEGATEALEYVDLLALADWLAAASEQFRDCLFAFCANSRTELMWMRRFAKLLSSDRIGADVFRSRAAALNWVNSSRLIRLELESSGLTR